MTEQAAAVAPQASLARFAALLLAVVYKDWLAFLAPLVIGIAWGAIYRRYPNLWGVVVSHAILGLISIMIGLV